MDLKFGLIFWLCCIGLLTGPQVKMTGATDETEEPAPEIDDGSFTKVYLSNKVDKVEFKCKSGVELETKDGYVKAFCKSPSEPQSILYTMEFTLQPNSYSCTGIWEPADCCDPGRQTARTWPCFDVNEAPAFDIDICNLENAPGLRSFRTDPEFAGLFHTKAPPPPPPPSLAESVNQRRKPLLDYKKLHVCSECTDLPPAPPFSEEEFEFLCNEIPDPMWNSTYCIERLNSLLWQAATSLGDAEVVEEVGESGHDSAAADQLKLRLQNRLVELFSFYRAKSPAGVLVQDANTLKNVLLICAGAGDSWFPILPEIGAQALAHFRLGFRIQKTSDSIYADGLVRVLDHFGKLLALLTSKSTTDAPANFGELAMPEDDVEEKRGTAAEVDTGITGTLLQLLETWFEIHDPSENETKRKVSKCVPLGNGSGDAPMPTPAPEDRPLDPHIFSDCLEQSELGPRLVQYLIESEGSSPFYVQVIVLLTKLVDRSDKIRALALAFPVLDPVLLHLKRPDPHCIALQRTVELIYSLLVTSGAGEEERPILTPCSPQAFEVLLKRSLQQMRHSESLQLRNLRNDATFTVYLLAKYVPALGAHFGRHAFVIAGIVANNVLGQQDIPFVLDSAPEDLELLEILLCILQLILDSDTKSREIITKYELVDILLRIVLGPCLLLDHFEPDDSALQRVVTCAWKVLNSVAKRYPPLLLEPVTASGDETGVDLILKVLKIYGEFGRLEPYVVTVLLDVVQTLLIHQPTAQDAHQLQMVTHFVHKGATAILTAVLTQLTANELPIAAEPSLCACLRCLATLCAHDQSQRDIFLQQNGVKILTLLMYKLIYEPADRRHLNPILQICVTDCAWRSLADSLASLEMFVAFDGVFRLLDLLEIAAGPTAELHILSTLVELCEYSRCVDQLLYWKRHPAGVGGTHKRCSHSEEYRVPPSRANAGHNQNGAPVEADTFGDTVLDSDQTLAALLCELWRAEEARLGCARDEQGCISDLDAPLNSEFSRQYRREEAEKGGNGPATLDMLCSVRPKIYLLVKRIIEATNTEATVFGSLSLKNQITMQIIVNFLDLKRGEIWLEMCTELKEEGVPLVESDAQALHRLRNISHNKVAATTETQRYLITRAEEHAEMHERELYNLLQQCHFQNHLLALREAERGARTANYFLLADKRLWQRAQLQAAPAPGGAATRMHRTTDEPLNVTIWPAGRQKLVTSEPPELEPAEVDSEHALVPSTVASSMSVAWDTSTTSIFGLDAAMVRHVLTRVRTQGELTMPGSNEEGYFQISPITLQKALEIVMAEQRKWNWSELDDDKAWRMRTKWRSDWYP